jgi:hypothetical protein
VDGLCMVRRGLRIGRIGRPVSWDEEERWNCVRAVCSSLMLAYS